MNANFRRILGSIVLLVVPILLQAFCNDMEEKPSLCPVMRFFHFPCPGCGLSKSLLCLAEGRLSQSLVYHPFGVVIEAFAALVLILAIVDERSNTNKVVVMLNYSVLWRVMAFSFCIFYFRRLVCLF